jgi:hypothetical protein
VKESIVLAMEGALAGDDLKTTDEILALIEELPSARRPRFLDAHVLRVKARLAGRRGDSDNADQGFTAAASAFREMTLPFWLAVTLLEHCEWLYSQQRLDDLRPLPAEAAEIFQRLGAAPWLRRLEAIGGDRSRASLDESLVPAAVNRAG